MTVTGKRVIGGSVLTCILLALTLLSTPSVASSTNHKLTPLQNGLNFYRGKTITFVIPAAPGGGYYAVGSTITPFLAAYLHATVNAESIPAGATLPGQDTAADATPDGLTLGEIGLSADVQVIFAGTPGLTFNPLRESFLGSGGTSPSVLLEAPNGPFKSFKAVEGGAPFRECVTPTGLMILNSAILYPAFRLNGKVLNGYPNTAAMVQGFIRGDCLIIDVPLATAGPLIQGDQGVALLATSPPGKGEQYGSLLKNVPTIAEQLVATPPKTSKLKRAVQALVDIDVGNSYEIFTASKVPGDRVAALRAAVKWAFTNPSFNEKASSIGLATGYHPGATDKATFASDLENEPIVTSYLQAIGG